MSVATELQRIERQQSGSGVKLSGRTLFNNQDYSPDMQGQEGTRRYERMRRDPEVAGSLLRIKDPIRAASWHIEEPESGTRVREMMDLCERYIIGPAYPGGETFTSSILPHALLALDFGFSAFEKVWGIDEKGRQVYARLAPILPQSVFEFVIGDLGKLERLVQYAYVGNEGFKKQTIPDPKVAPGVDAEDKLAVITFRKEGDDFFGRSILRECYQPWFHKSELWTLDGMQKERHGMGLTVITLPSSVVDVNSDEYRAAEKLVFELRAHERNGAVIGEGWKLEQLFPTGTAPDILGSQEYCDQQIARTMATEYSNLGSTASGSRALAQSKIDLFMIMEQTISNWVENFVNTQMIPGLIRKNFGVVKALPRIRCENIGNMSGIQAAEIVKLLHDASMLRYDRKLEEHLRANNDLPDIDDATREEPPDPMAIQPGENGDGIQSSKRPNAPVAKRAATEVPVAGVARLNREKMPHEAHVDMERIAEYLDSEPERIWHRVVAPIRADQIARIAQHAAALSDAQLSEAHLIHPGEKQMASRLSAALLEVYMAGRKAIVAETRAQKAAKADSDEEEDGDIEPTDADRRWIGRLAAGFSSIAMVALISEAVRVGLNARHRDLPASEVEALIRLGLTDLSEPRVMADLAGKVSQSYTTGRNDQIRDMRDQFATFHYSAVMDQATCFSCAALDGAEHEFGDDTYDTPNGNCEGGLDRCRCLTIAVTREEAA